MRVPSGDHTPGVDVTLKSQAGTPTAGEIDCPEVPRHTAHWPLFDDSPLAIWRQNDQPLLAWRSERADGLALPVDPGDLRACACGRLTICQCAAGGHRKHSGAIPRRLNRVGDGNRRILELQTASVKGLRQKRARTLKKHEPVRIGRRARACQNPLPRLVAKFRIEGTRVDPRDVGRSRTKVEEVFAIWQERRPGVEELSLGYVDLSHGRG